MSNNLSSVDFSFEPENRTSVGLVSGDTLTMRRDEVDDKPVYHLLTESGEIIGSAPSSAVYKLAGKTYVMRVSKDCRTVDVTIVTAGKVVNTTLDVGWSAWKGCMCMVLMVPFIIIAFASCSAILG